MKLLTDRLKKTLPTIGSQEHKNLNAIVYIKCFTPWSNWTWYVTEFDGKDLCFGLVIGFEREIGYFLLSELESISGPFGLKVERDIYFKPKTINQILSERIKR